MHGLPCLWKRRLMSHECPAVEVGTRLKNNFMLRRISDILLIQTALQPDWQLVSKCPRSLLVGFVRHCVSIHLTCQANWFVAPDPCGYLAVVERPWKICGTAGALGG